MAQKKPGNGAIVGKGLLWTIIATGLNSIIYLLANSVGVPFMVPDPQNSGSMMELELLPVTLFTFGPSIIAIILVLILKRFTRRPLTFYFIIAVLALVASFLPFSNEMAVSSIIVLTIMHFIAAGGVTTGIISAFRRR